MKTRKEVITEMCLTLRPDFHHVLAVEDNDFGVGITPDEQARLRSTMERILDDIILPNVDALKKGD